MESKEKIEKAAKRIAKSLEYALRGQAKLGESKHAAKAAAREAYLAEHGKLDGWNPAKADGIYSVGTLRGYMDEMPAFAAFCAARGAARIGEVTEKMAEDYLCECAEKGQSAWTVAKKASAINKAMGYDVRPKELGLEQRRKADIKRCREPAKENRRFKGCEDAIAFAKATGIRRMSVTVVRPRDCVRNAEGEVVGVHVVEKGGRARVAPVLSAMRGEATRIADKAAREHGEDVPMFPRYDRHIRNHRFRAEYAALLLHQLEDERAEGAAPFGGAFPLSEYAILRGKDKLRRHVTQGHDTDLLAAVSGALGHSRVDVVLRHYLYTY